MASSVSSIVDSKVDTEDRFRFVYSCDLDDACFKVKVGSLEGNEEIFPLSNGRIVTDRPDSALHDGDFKITCDLLVDGQSICPRRETPYRHFNSRWSWNEWLTFPVRISDLARNCIIRFTIWGSRAGNTNTRLGSTCLSVFSKHSCMRRGMYDLKVWTDDSDDVTRSGKAADSEQTHELNKMRKRYEKGLVLQAEWLDKLTFPEMERMREKERKHSSDMHLMIEFPRVLVDGQDCTVVYFEKEAEHPCHLLFDSDMLVVPDPEILLDNLAESKHHKLSRSLRSGVCDRDLKPNPQTRDLLNQIANYPSTKSLTSEEQDLVWKFRFYLINQKKALAKFLKCPHWNVASEAAQAIELLPKWSPMDIEDALELLSPQFQHPSVRKYAVSRLRQAPDEDLLLYLLQLVQALRYENYDRKDSATQSDGTSACFDDVHDNDSDLAAFLIERATGDERLANFFYWYLAVEIEEHKPADVSQATNQLPSENRIYYMYVDVMSKFSRKLDHGSPEQKQRREFLRRQQEFVEDLVKLMKEVAREKGDRIRKIERLRHLIKSNERFTSFEPLPLPLDPDVRIKAIQPDKASLFKSALMPSRLSFTTVNNQEYVAILKYGDDLRQDQLILQTITLIDKLLRRENLDLKLTPYRVLATSSKHGFVQYIESMSVAEVLKNYGDSIQRFFRVHAAHENAPYGVSPEVMDTYVKSCAGYCIITYLLGVGDRHLDNLLLTKSGNLFHIDFGYILGRDPKPFPPPMKLSREMVEGMGGVNSEHYQQFKKLCYTAFLHLRRHANLILNLFTLMVDATIPDIALEPDKTVKKVQDKFRLELSDEEAVHHIQTLIEVSATAVMASLVEQVHKFAQYWRK